MYISEQSLLVLHKIANLYENFRDLGSFYTLKSLKRSCGTSDSE